LKVWRKISFFKPFFSIFLVHWSRDQHEQSFDQKGKSPEQKEQTPYQHGKESETLIFVLKFI
jgi:hypothetical protein